MIVVHLPLHRDEVDEPCPSAKYGMYAAR